MRRRVEGWEEAPAKSLLGKPVAGDPIAERKLDIIEALVPLAEQSGISLVHLAVAFVLNHPAVTSAIIGPRTMEHLTGQLGAVDVDLSAGGPGPHRRVGHAGLRREPAWGPRSAISRQRSRTRGVGGATHTPPRL